MTLHYVVLLLVTVGFVSSSPYANLTRTTPGWPCPIQSTIAPCVCSQDTDYNLHMDCSKANSEEELARIFQSIFPFNDFYELKIIHDHNDVNNVIDQITASTFNEITFERIIITGTRLTEIVDEAFANSHRTLKHLDLSNNYLDAFPFESLALYTQLETFILDDNKFTILYDLDSPSLKVFSGSRNHNMRLDSATQFTLVPSLKELYLSEIGLTTLRPGLFNTTQLEVVDFSKNHLTQLEANTIRVKGKTLQHVSFDENEIDFIRHDALWGFVPNATLSLAANKLVLLEEEHWKHIFQQITWRESIDLRGNELLCGCEIDWLFMQHEQEYLCRLTDTTVCYNLQQIIFLDVHIYCDQCADSFDDCPPQIDCKNPKPF